MHLHSSITRWLAAAVLAFTAVPAFAADGDAARSILVLDASGSMWGQIDGKPKIAIAREAIGAMLDGWNGGDLGLIAYGHRRKGDCGDIELLIEPSGFDAAAIRRQASALNPKGMTPISAAVRQAAEHLRFTERKATVILVSDGEETCSADPCALGEELERLGVDFTAHIVGFDIRKGSKAQQQLQCLAANTGGSYIDARNAGELSAALQTVAAAPSEPAQKPAQPHLTLYPGENLKGAPVTLTQDVSNLQDVPASDGFDGTANDYAYSLEATGRWEVCMDWRFESDCFVVEGVMNSLGERGGGISSVRYLGPSH